MEKLTILDNIQKVKISIMFTYIMLQILSLLKVIDIFDEIDEIMLLGCTFVWFFFSSIKMYLIIKRKEIGYYLYICSNIGGMLLATFWFIPNVFFALLGPAIFPILLTLIYVMAIIYNLYMIKLIVRNKTYFKQVVK